MAANSIVTDNSAPSSVHIVLYAPDKRMLSALACIEGLESIVWTDSREIDPVKLQLKHPSMQLLLLDYTGGNTNYSQALAVAVSALPSPPAMLGVGSIPEGPHQSTQLLAAIRSGVRDFIDLSAPLEDVQDILKRVRREIRTTTTEPPIFVHKPLPEGDLIILLGVRPGLGTSTLAAHLASKVAVKTAENANPTQDCLLLDFGLPAGDSALYLGVEGGFHLEDALRNVSRIDATFVNTALAHHSTGLSVLARSSSAFPSEETSAVVQRLRCLYRLLICDLGGVDISSIPTALLLNARETWLISDQSIGSLLSLDRCLSTLEQRGARDERLHLVLNRHDESFGLTPEQIAHRFNLPLLVVIPERSKQIRSAASVGKLLHEQTGSDAYLTALTPLLQRLRPTAAAQNSSTFSRLANYIAPSKWKKS